MINRIGVRTPYARFAGVLALGGLWLLLIVLLAYRHPRFDHVFRAGETLSNGVITRELIESDFTAEPGEFSDSAERTSFFTRQEDIAKILSTHPQVLSANSQAFTPLPPSLKHLPLAFWIQILVGGGAFLISAWIWALRAGHRPSFYFFLSGIATLAFTSSSAIYTTRTLALPLAEFKPLIHLNEAGASAFGIFIIHLFLFYPLPLARAGLFAWLSRLFFGFWTLAAIGEWLPAWAGVNLVTLTEMIGICIAIVWQFFATKGKTDARASLLYLGLSVILGAGFFIALNAVPLVFGSGAAIGQEYGFLSFLLIYLGLAAGISRFRLFDVGRLSYSLLFYGFGSALLLILNGLLIQTFGFDRGPAFAFSLFSLGLLYLPLKEGLRKKFVPQTEARPEVITDLILKVAFAPTKTERDQNWLIALNTLFKPLEMKALDVPAQTTRLVDDGMGIDIPAVHGLPSLSLRYKAAGRELFSDKNIRLTQKLLNLLQNAETLREAYDRGADEERLRMAQDLHDDIGGRLISAIHSVEEASKPRLHAILSDLRALVSEVAQVETPLYELLADIRFETSERLNAKAIKLHWDIDKSLMDDETPLGFLTHKALRSGFRELVSNVIRHANASEVKIFIARTGQELSIAIEDNGQGVKTVPESIGGFGLKSLKTRIQKVEGSIKTSSSAEGFKVAIQLPLPKKPSPPRIGDDFRTSPT